MEGEIVNRVAQSSLRTLDLEELYPQGPRHGLDISPWLDQGIILREQPFREAVKAHDWAAYQDAFVYLYCSSDAIVPTWAYMLISTHLAPVARKVVVGSRELLESVIFSETLAAMDVEPFRDKPVIIKGCSHLPVPPTAYTQAVDRLLGVARTIQFGEACSSVPLYRRK
ncbi:DUF2480 family protein [Robiginitalea sp. M366]|uniref:DUF2480 family protein n=1 Tax=Robiginitalea aestuariiviva TaxID=3036903 RepID=UPI00240E6447|nr:DUF2480 family protein [Robiginitalea aestuariiviva]MDG1571367.1 DUF2480 family protein [Robiginitalea aestuariiviva]